MMDNNPVVQSYAYLLAHTPELVRYGSRPKRDILSHPELERQIRNHLRTFEQALSYAPNQVYLGELHPEDLSKWPAPWWRHPVESARPTGSYGPFLDQLEFYAFLKAVDQFDLAWFTPQFTECLAGRLEKHPLSLPADRENLGAGHALEEIEAKVEREKSLALFLDDELVGAFRREHEDDEALQADVLLENLATKATGAVVVRALLHRSGLDPGSVDYIVSCSEEAVGDRYQRGGGNLAKAVGESCGLINATGSDIKAFCAGPLYAMVHAGSLVKAGVFDRVVVFGGGCLSKLGMKFAGHLKHGIPILEDVLAGMAFLVARDDRTSPVIRLDSVGRHRIGDGSSQQDIYMSLVVRPLEKIGLKMTAVGKFATELHNPEVTVPQGSGNVPLNNYKMIAALGVLHKVMRREEMEGFIAQRGMPGFSPTQGHIPAALPYLGHAAEAMAAGKLKSAFFVAKGSMFLGRMSRMADGLSFLLERNHGNEKRKISRR